MTRKVTLEKRAGLSHPDQVGAGRGAEDAEKDASGMLALRSKSAASLVGGEEGLEVAADPGGDGALSIDGPGEHGAAVDVLD